MAKKIWVTRINEELPDFRYLFSLYNRVFDDDLDKVLDFSFCDFIRPNGVAFIGGIISLANEKNINISIDWTTVAEEIKVNLTQNGFIEQVEGNTTSWSGNSVPYREDELEQFDEKDIVSHLLKNWLSSERIKLSSRLKNDIVNVVFEIFINGKEHSKSTPGIFSCGQYFPTLKELSLTVLDFGVGIPTNVRNYYSNNSIKAGNAIKWAFSLGTTTDNDKVAGGNGLNRLCEFIEINEGKMYTFSYDGLAITDRHGTKFTNFKQNYFPGTLVCINLKCEKNTFYSYTSK